MFRQPSAQLRMEACSASCSRLWMELISCAGRTALCVTAGSPGRLPDSCSAAGICKGQFGRLKVCNTV